MFRDPRPPPQLARLRPRRPHNAIRHKTSITSRGSTQARHLRSHAHPLYRNVLKHYGAAALLCRVQDPEREGKVESGVGHAQKTPLKGLRFNSLEEAQSYVDRWKERWADTRIHGTTKRQVAAMCAVERPALLPLPVEPFAITSTANARCTWMAASRSRPLITARRRLDQPAGPGSMGHLPRVATESAHGRTAPGAPAPRARRVLH